MAAAVVSAVAVIVAAAIPSLLGSGSEGDPVSALKGVEEVERSPDAQAPLTVAVQQSDEYCREGWIVPGGPDHIAEPSSSGDYIDWPAWARQQGGIRVNRHEVMLTVQGNSQARVVIDRVRVVALVPRRSPVRGTEVDILCGEPFEYRYLEANLDRSPPTVTSKTTGSISGEPDVRLDPAKFPYQVAIDEAESFIISAVVSKYDIDWRIELDWSSQGRVGTLVIDDGGQPFHTTSTSEALARCVWADAGGLIKDMSSGCNR
ncbi:hypothetical protein EYA84_17370 [Verrucosispora sp. SN26_14.1]|uniref:hypothetical protein n=1 Tax=Verrucosispora sp. SN26_14.1 TaxID=2527879 RepID=UPI00103524D5|nr:hypothetical protein [Verrucosispora sp. SN26_14.1]TBL33405.1 hypothetical protein EYA84_17370 [Verrucosispora sp. SN26_14.1]